MPASRRKFRSIRCPDVELSLPKVNESPRISASVRAGGGGDFQSADVELASWPATCTHTAHGARK
jgi:hypothetical protein